MKVDSGGFGVPVELTREELISICVAAEVPVTAWRDRDTPTAQRQVGECWALLRAGCDFTVREEKWLTIWVDITHPTFGTFDHDAPPETTLFYLPTIERLQPGRDWY